MRGLWLEAGRARVRDDLDAPRPGPGECRVRVLRAGVCATDLALARGYMGFSGIPGHEFVGEVLDGPRAGERVVGEINAGCGACARCLGGDPRHCEGRSVLGIVGRHGAFAEELVLPAGNLVRVPDDVSTDAAVFAEPLAAALAIGEAVDLSGVQEALVVGDGRLGLLCAQAVALDVPRVDVHGRHPDRFEWILGDAPLADRLAWSGEPRGRSYDLVVEATGDPSMVQTALAWVRPRGTLVLKTTSEREVPLDLAPLVVDEIRLVGSRCGRFEPALQALDERQIPVERLIEARFPLGRADDALSHAGRGAILKVLIDGEEPAVGR